MTTEADDAATLAAAEDAAFASGFPEKAPDKPAEPPAQPEPAAAPTEAPAKPVEEQPEYVQVSAKEWAEVRAAAAKTASYDAQLSKLFGTVGNLQKQTADKQAGGGNRKVEIPKEAFAAMERDFPELAQHTRAALEAALSGVPGGAAGEIDVSKVEAMLATHAARREIEALEDAYPDWRTIVGAVDATREEPDPKHPFRQWLATKDATYQARINKSESAAVIARAIRTFQAETKAPAKPTATTPRSDARAERMREAVQPRGDNAGAAPGKSDEDEFLAGFQSR